MAQNAGAQALIRGVDWHNGKDLAEIIFSLLEIP
jgi:hypothetical protein